MLRFCSIVELICCDLVQDNVDDFVQDYLFTDGKKSMLTRKTVLITKETLVLYGNGGFVYLLCGQCNVPMLKCKPLSKLL